MKALSLSQRELLRKLQTAPGDLWPVTDLPHTQLAALERRGLVEIQEPLYPGGPRLAALTDRGAAFDLPAPKPPKRPVNKRERARRFMRRK
jgi:hypothetical protein